MKWLMENKWWAIAAVVAVAVYAEVKHKTLSKFKDKMMGTTAPIVKK